MEAARRSKPPDRSEDDLIQRLTKGNPLLDPEEFERRLAMCETDEQRERLQDWWDAVQNSAFDEKFEAFERQQKSDPPDEIDDDE